MSALAEAARGGVLSLVERAVARVVEDSFTSHPMRHKTRAEVLRRTDLCLRWINKLCDKGYTLDRALHALHHPLLAELDGRRWEPSADNDGLFGANERIVGITDEILQHGRGVALAN